MNAARKLTTAAIDAGEKPAVSTGIVKAYLTESMRSVVADAMDIRAGAGICRGPRNPLASAYLAAPIGITVEGANILTRSLIVYGQGAIRCHRFLCNEMDAARSGDVTKFDAAFFGHARMVARNVARAFLYGWTGGPVGRRVVPGAAGEWARQLTRASCCFAVLSDATMLTLGGALKRREKISGRLADALAWLYLGSAVIKRYDDEGQPAEDFALARWGVEHALHEVQYALIGVLDNLPSRAMAALLRIAIMPFGARRKPPNDALGAEVVRALLEGGARERLTAEMFVPRDDELGLGRLENALRRVRRATAIEKRLRQLVRTGKIEDAPLSRLALDAYEGSFIDQAEYACVIDAERARRDAIEVDAFDAEPRVGVPRRDVSTITAAAQFTLPRGETRGKGV
jgi:acyl-CoA dehydrogenase